MNLCSSNFVLNKYLKILNFNAVLVYCFWCCFELIQGHLGGWINSVNWYLDDLQWSIYANNATKHWEFWNEEPAMLVDGLKNAKDLKARSLAVNSQCVYSKNSIYKIGKEGYKIHKLWNQFSGCLQIRWLGDYVNQATSRRLGASSAKFKKKTCKPRKNSENHTKICKNF